MPEVTTEIKGLRELKANLERLGPAIAKGVMTEGLEAGGAVLMEAIGERTPVHRGVLKEHIVMATEVAPSGAAGRVKVGFGDEGYKAKWVEFGHRQVSHGPASERKEIGHVAAHPFIRPGFDASKEAAREKVIEVIRAQVAEKTGK
jgi:HK97 gp10 family phage protein